MTMRQTQMLAVVFERVAEAVDRAVFAADEIARWPWGAIETLEDSSLLKRAQRASSVTCLGCERRCRRPVEAVQSRSTAETSFVSTCHLIVGMGPFEHAPTQLSRWISTRVMVADFVGGQLSLRAQGRDDKARKFRFGTWRNGGLRRALSLEFDDTVELLIGGNRIDLAELVSWGDDGLRTRSGGARNRRRTVCRSPNWGQAVSALHGQSGARQADHRIA